MDNLRLEPFSAHPQAGAHHHHLLPFGTPPSIEFSPLHSKPNLNCGAHQQTTSSFSSSSWASLWPEQPQYCQNPNALLKQSGAMQSPDRGTAAGGPRTWDVSTDPILQPRHGHSINVSAEFTHSHASAGSASMEALSRDSPTLQLKHGSTLLAPGFGHLSAPMDASRADNSHLCTPINVLREGNVHIAGDFRKDNTHLPGLLVAMDKGSTSPVSVVSGPQPVLSAPRKMEAPQNQTFVSFSWHDRDDPERASTKGKDWAPIVKAEVMGGTSAGLMGSIKGELVKQGSVSEEKGVTVKREQEEGVTIASLEDGSIGLKLGKRTYYGDVGGGEEASRRVNSSSTCNVTVKNGNSKNSSSVSCAANTAASESTITAAATTTTATTNTNTNNSRNNGGGTNSNKKQKGSSASAIVPSCQAEGCTADLSDAKDYHRRHKVCEWHSKASRARVNNLEQRFCQQCSRFHVLSAFDEGKRSCRRRLAGHNERRRKPPPEPMPFLSPSGFAYFADGRVNAALHEHPYFLQRRQASLVSSSVDNAVLASQLGLAGFPQRESMGNYHALELHHFMQGLPPGGGPGVGVLDGGGNLMLANGNALALSNAPPSLPTASSSSPVGLLPHVSSEMAISGRALSLLSSSLGSPETMSISLGMTSSSIDQFLSDTHVLASSHQQVAPNSTSCFSSGIGMPSTASLHGLPQSHTHALNSLTSSSSGCSAEMDQGEPPSMSNFEGRSLFLMKSENGFHNLQDGGNCNQGRPMLDLMHISPAESHHHHHEQSQTELSYADLQGFSIFNRQNMM